VFVPAGLLSEMTQVVAAVEAASGLAGYREAARRWAAPLAHRDFGPAGALMGYDFHVTHEGAKLIEINTNAGGAFLNASLASAQRACCASTLLPVSKSADFGSDIAEMFLSEWARQRGGGRPRRMAILDDAPETQYLLPEFRLAQAMLQSQGIETLIGDPRDLVRDGNAVTLTGLPIDLIYNRLVDFAFDDPAHAILRDAYQDDVVVVTPNPYIYAVFADKRDLCLLYDNDQMAGWGLTKEHLEALAGSTFWLQQETPMTYGVSAEIGFSSRHRAMPARLRIVATNSPAEYGARSCKQIMSRRHMRRRGFVAWNTKAGVLS
jgi:hypothetical protein